MIDRIGAQLTPSTNLSNSVQRDTSEVKATEPLQSTMNEETDQQEQNPKEKLEKIVEGMNKFVSASNTHLKFQLHDKLNEYYVTIVDNNTQEVVKEIPSKKMLDIFAAMNEYLGLMVDKKI